MHPAALSAAVPPTARRWLRRSAYFAAWAACVLVAWQRIDHARHEFDRGEKLPADERRADGNSGHTAIDFGGQFIMGRMLATGHGRELFRRQALWPVVRESFPVADETPRGRRGEQRHDAEALMGWVMGADAAEWPAAASAVTLRLAASGPLTAATLAAAGDSALTVELVAAVNEPSIGGPLYPPTHAIVYAPLTLTNDPQAAYAAFQWLSLGLTFSAGLAIQRISRGRVWFPLATLAVLLFPGYRSGLDLGQNQVLTLNILLWGWVLAGRSRDGWAGFVWGLLAFKPVWAVAFLAVPLVMGRGRMLAAMCVTGGAAVLLTLPVVGVQTWLDWLAVGREATDTYNTNENWILLSRDLAGVVRRAAIDFATPVAERDTPALRAACALALLVVAAATATVYRLRRHAGGQAEGFLLLGAYLCCFHFMYYDAVVALLPLAALAAAARPGGVYELRDAAGRTACWASVNSAAATAVALLLLLENWVMSLALGGGLSLGYLGTRRDRIGGMPEDAPRLTADTTIYSPNDTLILFALWAVLAVRLVAARQPTPRSALSAAPMSAARISDSPTSTARTP